MEKIEYLLFRYIIKEEGEIKELTDRLNEIKIIDSQQATKLEIKEKEYIESILEIFGRSREYLQNKLALQEALSPEKGQDFFSAIDNEKKSQK